MGLGTQTTKTVQAGVGSKKYGSRIANNINARPIASFDKTAADGAAATATAETVLGGVPADIAELTACRFTPAAGLAGNGANNATINVKKRTAGGAAVVVATLTTTANWTAWVPVSIPLVAGMTLAAEDALTWEITKAGTGVVVPAGKLELF